MTANLEALHMLNALFAELTEIHPKQWQGEAAMFLFEYHDTIVAALKQADKAELKQ